MIKKLKIMAIILGILGSFDIIINLIPFLSFRSKVASSIAVIGGADGPTSIFVAGKIGNGAPLSWGIACLVASFILAVIVFRKKK
ncbi:MAG: sodium ion-translocating decarboxylase subunit beta [Clostridium sp.]